MFSWVLYVNSMFAKRHLFLIWLCLFVAVVLLVVDVSGGSAFFSKNWYKLDCKFFLVTLTKVLLTDLLNFASKRKFPSFRSF